MKKIKWLIQDVGIRYDQLNRKIEALVELNEDINFIGVIPKHPYITGIEENFSDKDTIYVLLSGTKALSILYNAENLSEVSEYYNEYDSDKININIDNFKKGIFYDNKKFDQNFYKNLNLPLLNQDSLCIPIVDNLNKIFNTDKFIKPSRDLKAFTGGILYAGTSIEEYIKNTERQNFYIEEYAIIAPVKNIINEYRFFIVDGKVSSYSAYVINSVAKEDSYVPDFIIKKAEEYCTLFQPDDIFTMDLALLSNDEIKIVEYNCFNVSGVYLSNIKNTFIDIKNYIENKKQ